MKRKQICIMVVVVAIVIGLLTVAFYLHRSKEIRANNLLYSQEYVPGTGNIKGDLDVKEFTDISSKFAIGANSYGYAVFKDPDAAWNVMKKKYSAGIRLIQKENHLSDLSKSNYESYKELGDQVTGGTKKEQEEAAFISDFLDIYENSFINETTSNYQ